MLLLKRVLLFTILGTFILAFIVPFPEWVSAEPAQFYHYSERAPLPNVATDTTELRSDDTITFPIVVINEFLPQPGNLVDWNGDGTANSSDEWIELWNTTDTQIDLSRWILDDIASGGSSPFTLPEDSMIEADGYLVIYKSGQASGGNSNLGLNNSGDDIRLLSPDGSLIDSTTYDSAATDQSDRRHPLTLEWETTDTPTPRAINIFIAEEEVTPTPDEPAPDESPPTPVEPIDPLPEVEKEPDATILAAIKLNEILPAPGNQIDWDEDGQANSSDEWIELVNTHSVAVDIGGWLLDDLLAGGSSIYTIPDKTLIPADGYLTLFKSTRGDVPGTGLTLNNTGDQVVLMTPGSAIVDQFEYTTTHTDVSFARDPNDLQWTETTTPTPGKLNKMKPLETAPDPVMPEKEEPEVTDPSPTSPDPSQPISYSDAIILSEILPSPSGNQDVNDDGKTDSHDEMIELYNTSKTTVNLSGWQLDDVADGGSSPYSIPTGTTIKGNGFLLFVRSPGESQVRHTLALNDADDCVRLLDPLGKEKESRCYENQSKGNALALDMATKEWKSTNVITPGKANIFGGTVAGAEDSIPDPLSIDEIKHLSLGSRIHLVATVTVPPGIFSDKRFYVRDDAGQGIAVEISDDIIPALSTGSRVRIRSTIEEKNAEFFIKTTGATLQVLPEVQTHPQAVDLKIDALTELREGQLVRIQGQVVESSGTTFIVSDGTGRIKVLIDPDTGIKKPRTTEGTWVQITGIFSQYKIGSTKDDGYRLLPRFQADVQIGLAKTGLSGEKYG